MLTATFLTVAPQLEQQQQLGGVVASRSDSCMRYRLRKNMLLVEEDAGERPATQLNRPSITSISEIRLTGQDDKIPPDDRCPGTLGSLLLAGVS